MSLTILNSVSSLTAENALSSTQMSLQKTLTELSTGLKINSGSDDAAGLAIANGLGANISALTQSSQNASDGVGLLQTADGALSQVTSLLNRAVTLATEASNGGLSTSQSDALNTGTTTNFNGEAVFGTTATVYTSDGTTNGSSTISTAVGALTTTALGLSTTADATPGTTTATDLSTAAGAQGALALVTTAISKVAANRGAIGAAVNQLTADTNVQNTEVTNLTSAQNNIQNADIGQTVAQMTQYNVLEQTGMAALSQSNQAQQAVLKLLQ
jgi:flagellin